MRCPRSLKSKTCLVSTMPASILQLAGLCHAAAGDLLGRRGLKAGPLKQRDLRGAEELRGVQAREHPAPPADRSAYSLDDHRGTHQDHPPLLERVLWVWSGLNGPCSVFELEHVPF